MTTKAQRKTRTLPRRRGRNPLVLLLGLPFLVATAATTTKTTTALNVLVATAIVGALRGNAAQAFDLKEYEHKKEGFRKNIQAIIDERFQQIRRVVRKHGVQAVLPSARRAQGGGGEGGGEGEGTRLDREGRRKKRLARRRRRKRRRNNRRNGNGRWRNKRGNNRLGGGGGGRRGGGGRNYVHDDEDERFPQLRRMLGDGSGIREQKQIAMFRGGRSSNRTLSAMIPKQHRSSWARANSGGAGAVTYSSSFYSPTSVVKPDPSTTAGAQWRWRNRANETTAAARLGERRGNETDAQALLRSDRDRDQRRSLRQIEPTSSVPLSKDRRRRPQQQATSATATTEMTTRGRRRGQANIRNLGAVAVIVSAVSPGLTVDTSIDFYCAGVESELSNGNQFNPFVKKASPSDITLLDCLFTNSDFYVWTIDAVAESDVADGFFVTTAHLANLNDVEVEGEIVDEYNLWMAVDKVENGETVFVDRTSVFDVAPVDPAQWLFLPGPIGDKSWRPWPQNPYNRNLCVSAQKQNGTVDLGNACLLKPCEDEGKGRQRQTWIYCGKTFGCEDVVVATPLFDVEIIGELENGERRGGNIPNNRVSSNNFSPSDDVQEKCGITEKDLVQDIEVRSWSHRFTLEELGYNITAVQSALVSITINQEEGCREMDASEFGLDTIIRFYEDFGNSTKWVCAGAKRLSCNSLRLIDSVRLNDLRIQNGRTYYITASGATEAEDCVDRNFGFEVEDFLDSCFF